MLHRHQVSGVAIERGDGPVVATYKQPRDVMFFDARPGGHPGLSLLVVAAQGSEMAGHAAFSIRRRPPEPGVVIAARIGRDPSVISREIRW